ncbi:HlyD family secretion protein [Aureivirga marina]|uniref:HlyD family secretion protein n=1 Tax=Aureivirga marina TaxID=1182451 RepID=UPI0018CB0A3D|nr:HlyD family secretion protein [Aureivirga marina]
MNRIRRIKHKVSNKHKVIIIIFIIVVLLFSIRYIYHAITTTSTDNAQIQSHIYPIISEVSGKIVELNIGDNETVRKGDTLLIIEQTQYINNVSKALANVENAKLQIEVAESNLEKSGKNLEAAIAKLEEIKAQNEAVYKEFRRKRNLFKNNAIPKASFDAISAKNKAAKAQEREQVAMVKITEISHEESELNSTMAEANFLEAEAILSNAKFELKNTYIIAPENGRTPNLKITIGQVISAGQILTELVGEKLWIIANYKETQIRHLEEGMDAIIEIDAFPRKEFKAKLVSRTNATGAKFALLPTDNATGNFVKIVQRIPVKFEFVDDEIYKIPIASGMSVTVIVENK